jgi:hypothetical protein
LLKRKPPAQQFLSNDKLVEEKTYCSEQQVFPRKILGIMFSLQQGSGWGENFYSGVFASGDSSLKILRLRIIAAEIPR